jgi:Ser/Thr protein kinase RdoA (MazF antagonist)
LKKINAGITATIFRYDNNQVLKLYRPTFPKEAIDEEFQIGLYLNRCRLQVPQTHALLDVEGCKGIAFEYVPGHSMLQSLAAKPWRVFSYSILMAGLHWDIHSAPISTDNGILSLKESLVNKILRATLLTSAERATIISRLSALKGGSAICHGDFHPDNIIISKTRIVTVDWLTARIGNPMADVARTWLLLTMGTIPENKTAFELFLVKYLRDLFYRGYLREYKRLSNFAADEFEEWKLPVAAARLIENVSDQENHNLLRFIRMRLQKRR